MRCIGLGGRSYESSSYHRLGGARRYLLLGPQLPMAAPGFDARFVAMPPSISLETYHAAVKAAANRASGES
jgi:hypothetical protein